MLFEPGRFRVLKGLFSRVISGLFSGNSEMHGDYFRLVLGNETLTD